LQLNLGWEHFPFQRCLYNTKVSQPKLLFFLIHNVPLIQNHHNEILFPSTISLRVVLKVTAIARAELEMLRSHTSCFISARVDLLRTCRHPKPCMVSKIHISCPSNTVIVAIHPRRPGFLHSKQQAVQPVRCVNEGPGLQLFFTQSPVGTFLVHPEGT
jgi:hypothetical protein